MLTKDSLSGESIKSMRKEFKWTQSDLARYLGVDDSLVSRIESGRREPTDEQKERLQKLIFIAQKMNVSPAETEKAEEEEIDKVELERYREGLVKLQLFHSQKVNRLKRIYFANICLSLLAPTFFLVAQMSAADSYFSSGFSVLLAMALLALSTYSMIYNVMYKLKKHIEQLGEISSVLYDLGKVPNEHIVSRVLEKACLVLQQTHEMTFLSKKDRRRLPRFYQN